MTRTGDKRQEKRRNRRDHNHDSDEEHNRKARRRKMTRIRRRTSRERDEDNEDRGDKEEGGDRRRKGKRKEEDGRQQQRRRPTPQQQDGRQSSSLWSSLPSFHPSSSAAVFLVQRPMGATSSTSIKLSNIKQRLINDIKGLLDFNIEHNKSDLFDSKQRQQDISSISMPPEMAPSSSGSASASVLEPSSTSTVCCQRGEHQRQAQPADLKLRDNKLYQHASPTFLSFYDNFNSIFFFLANKHADQPQRQPIADSAVHNFINNMCPFHEQQHRTMDEEFFHLSQRGRTSLLPTASDLGATTIFTTNRNIKTPTSQQCHLQPQLHRVLGINGSNQLIQLPAQRRPQLNSAALQLRADNVISSSTWSRYNRHAGFLELEPSDNQLSVAPTSTWDILDCIVRGPSASTLSFIKYPSWTSNHIVDYNLVSHPHKIYIPSIISMIQHHGIRQRIKTSFNSITHRCSTSSFCHRVIFSQSGQQRHRHPSSTQPAQQQQQQLTIKMRQQQHHQPQQVHQQQHRGWATHHQ